MSLRDERERIKRPVFHKIRNWLFEHYENYEPKAEMNGILSISYVENDCLYKLNIQICDSTNIIRYFVELPYSIEPKLYNELLEKINEHHLKACIGRYELNKQKGILIYNYWNSYDPEKLDFELLDKGMGISMICCKERFGLIKKEGASYEEDDSYVRWTDHKNSSAHNLKVN